jgi:hypothetical protein
MSINHLSQAERYLSYASWFKGTGPDAVFTNPESAAILATLANAHAALAHLPEQQVNGQEQLRETQRDLALTQRVVGEVIADALIDGHDAAQQAVHSLAYALKSRYVGVEAQIEARMEVRGHTYDPDGPPPVYIAEAEPPARPTGDDLAQAAFRSLAARYRDVIAEFIAGELTSSVDGRWCVAQEFSTLLDGLGLNVDDAVDQRLDSTDMGQLARKRPSVRYPHLGDPWTDEPPF